MTEMSLSTPTLASILLPALDERGRPRPVGTLRAGSFTGHLLAYLIHNNDLLAVLYGTASKAARDSLWAAILKGRSVDFVLDTPRSRVLRPKRLSGAAAYERFDHEGPLPASNGHPLLLISRAALTSYLAVPPEKVEFDHFITFGPAGSDRPHALWLTQLRQLVLLPELPGWADVLWEAAVDLPSSTKPLVQAVSTSAGFASAWLVAADAEAWRAIYTRLAKGRRLPLPAKSTLAPAEPPRVEWSLREFRGWGGRT